MEKGKSFNFLFYVALPTAPLRPAAARKKIVEAPFRHDYAALASSGRVGQNAKVVP
jgi:hypothetical protein